MRKHHSTSHKHAKHAHHMHDSFLDLYKESWKNSKSWNFFLIAIFDLVFFFLASGSMLVFFKIMGYLSQSVINNPSLSPNGLEAIVQFTNSVIGFYATIFLAAILFLVIVLFFFTVSRGLIWSVLAEEKLTNKEYAEFFLTNGIWFAILSIPFILLMIPVFMWGLKGNFSNITLFSYVFGVFFFVAGYYSYLMFYSFVRTKKIWGSIKEAFVAGTTHIKKMGTHALAAFASVIIIMLLTRLILVDIPLLFSYKLPELLLSILGYVVFFGTFSWVRIYASIIFKRFVRPH